MNRGSYIVKCVLLGLVAIALVGFITLWLWNWLVPILFNGPVINYIQALGLLLLSKILFWGFGAKQNNCNCGMHSSSWKYGVHEKFSEMTPEQREAFKQKMKEKWCRWEQKSSGADAAASKE